jgi:hypothetical protein
MKKFLLVALTFCALPWSIQSSFAEEIKITSFYLVNTTPGANDRAAEVCFKLTDSPLPRLVKISADPNTNREGHYYVMVGSSSKACLSIVTLLGKVKVEFDGALNNSEVNSEI